jgi:hypothetical protein
MARYSDSSWPAMVKLVKDSGYEGPIRLTMNTVPDRVIGTLVRMWSPSLHRILLISKGFMGTSRLTDVHPVGAELHFVPITTRMPLNFGPETCPYVTCAHVRATVVDCVENCGRYVHEARLA